MIKRGARPKAGFYVLANEIINDKLSWSARGLLVYLLSKPDDWSVNVKQLIAETEGTKRPAGRDAVYGLLDELESAGYVAKEQDRGENGLFSVVHYVVNEKPVTASGLAVSGESTASGLAVSGSTVSGKSGSILNTETSLQKTVSLQNTDTPPQKNAPCAMQKLVEKGADVQHAKDWIAVRKAKRAPLTDSAIASLEREASKAGITFSDAVRMCAERGWQSLKADWLERDKPSKHDPHRDRSYDRMHYETPTNPDDPVDF